MKGILRLGVNEESELFNYNLYMGINSFDYEITINTDLSDDFAKLIFSTGDIEEAIDFELETSNDPEVIDFYKQVKGKQRELLQNAEYVAFNFDIKSIANYVKKNPILKTKKILITDVYDLNPDIVKDIQTYFGDETSNIYFDVAGNNSFISFKEYGDTIRIINEMVDDTNRFNFSPLEKIMYAYDLVRNRVYTSEGDNEDKNISRTLSSVLLGDKIVCAGYAVVFKTLLEKLGINNREVYLYNADKTGGHARNEIYVQDEKYGIDGVYYFDTTWDSKKEEDDNSYLLRYRFFAKTKESMDRIDNGRLVDENFPYFSKDIIEKVKKIIKEKGVEGISPLLLKSVNHMSSVVYGRSIINKHMMSPLVPEAYRLTEDKIMADLEGLSDYFTKPLSADVLLEVLYNVRKNQYYLDPEKYQFGLNEFLKIVLLSGWEFDGTKEEQLLLRIVSPKEITKIKQQQLVRYSLDTDLFKKIERIKAARLLRSYYERKKLQQKM